MTWTVRRPRDDAATFHARPMPIPMSREVWVCEPSRPALVLGSAQREVADISACSVAGVEVVRRHSGGGAVLVEPGNVLWVDVLLPAQDPQWVHDVGHSFLWLGEIWAKALGDVGIAVAVHRGGLVRTRWSDLVCFAGLGPGELTDASGRKMLGISQRRTREGARFQCAVLSRWDARAIVNLLALPGAARTEAASDLADSAVGVGIRREALLHAFLTRLP